MNFFDPRQAPSGAALTPVAANEDFGPAKDPADPRVEPPPATRGWDAFEVWRTRVRDARRDVAPRRLG